MRCASALSFRVEGGGVTLSIDRAAPAAPAQALSTLAAQLRDEESVISPFVEETSADPALGLLASVGPRAHGAPGEYALLVECIREGYLLHYATPRVVVGADPNLALLAGDYLYARGLERLANLGDIAAVRELSDLISLLAQAHVRETRAASASPTLWLASVVAVAAGPSAEHELAKAAVRADEPDALRRLAVSAAAEAANRGIGGELAVAAETVGLESTDLFDLG